MSHDQEASWASMIPTFSQLIQLYFILIITIAFLAATLPSLRDSILTYGKLDSPASSSTPSVTSSFTSASVSEENIRKNSFFTVLKSFRVPKTWFAHFYVFATLWMIYLSLDLVVYSSSRKFLSTVVSSTHRYWSFLSLLNALGIMPSQPTAPSSNRPSSVLPFPSTDSSMLSWTPPPEVLLAMACYLVHVIRRWYESWFVERPSAQAKIHVGQYLVGISFYAAMAPALWVDAYESWNRELQVQAQGQEQAQGRQGSVLEHSYEIRPNAALCLIGLVLFLWGSWHQHQCHVILANLRSPTSASSISKGITEHVQEQKHMPRKQEYKVPFGDWFKYMVTPHYSAEMVIYFGFLLMVSSSGAVKGMATTLLIAWIWVVVNLGIVARETDQWYRMRFGEEYADMSVMDNVQQQSRSKKERTRTRTRRAILIPFVY
ncbi:hypothetical protein BGZ51_008470 [Haplosporangium sp. Z 767]|nr:hypothetical protein BGZ50_008797 [Haplosporangium sp. Z 11]KAF9177660.1 hypothetical protein BGZ51_008470 [Haplosporangium sp. Z 767]